MRLIFSDDAETDLEEIGDYIAQDSPRRALSYLKELRQACDGLCEAPLRFPHLQNYEAQSLRRRPYGNYAIIYRVDGDAVLIVRVLNAALDLDNALN